MPVATLEQRKESSTTGSFLVAQFDSVQKPFVAFGIVPVAVTDENEDRSFEVNAKREKTVAQTLRAIFAFDRQQRSAKAGSGQQLLSECSITKFDRLAVVQCKEKFGSARWYWGMTGVKAAIRVDLISPTGHTSYSSRAKPRKSQDQTLALQLNQLIDAGEQETNHSCIVCGKHGVNDQGDGWYVVLCAEHAQMRKQGGLPPIWFEDEDHE